MNIAFITNLRAPYRTLQLNEFSKIKDVKVKVYYTNKRYENRKWETEESHGFSEVDLKGIKLSECYGYINIGILKIVKENDLILLGGYEQPTIILISLLCRMLKKPYIILFDGISCDRILIKEKGIKKVIKNIVVQGSSYIMANGIIGKKYFEEQFDYDTDKIYNQYLSVNSDLINKLYDDRENLRIQEREKLGINENDKVILFSGRLIELKNVETLIRAISKIQDTSIVLLITGGGELQEKLKQIANNMNVRMIITGFIYKQEDLFKMYFAGDCFVLPSLIEPWGLVVNEAMHAGMPIIVSQNCGCRYDLIKNNGLVFNPKSYLELSKSIEKIIYNDNIVELGIESRNIISKWNFNNSKKSLENIINKLYK